MGKTGWRTSAIFLRPPKYPPFSEKIAKKSSHTGGRLACHKSLTEFAARRRQRNEIIFSRDMCVRENTARAASVEFVRHRRTNYARSRPQAFCRKNPKGFSTVSPPTQVGGSAWRKICHCEPVRRLAWQSVSKAPDFRLFCPAARYSQRVSFTGSCKEIPVLYGILCRFFHRWRRHISPAFVWRHTAGRRLPAGRHRYAPAVR